VILPGQGAVDERLQRQEEEIESLCGEVLARYEEATLVYRLSERIGSVLGERAIARLVLSDAAAVLGAAGGEVWLRQGDGLVLAAGLPDEAHRAPDRTVDDVMSAGGTWVREGAVGAAAAIVVPLPDGRGGALGALCLRGRPAGRAYLTGEAKLIAALAALASAFIRNDRLSETARHEVMRRREDDIARQVHRNLLPRQDPLFAGLDIAGAFRAAESVGGDYYGYMAMSDGSLGVAIADVSGHGVGAALYMATAKGALQSEAREVLSPAELLFRVNEVLASDFSAADMFATLAFARFLPDGRRLVWSNAGQNAPLLLRADGSLVTLPASGPAVGIVSGPRWRDASCRFEAGDVLLLYTDGVVEARDRTKKPYGVERLAAAARRSRGSAATIREAILEDLARATDNAPPKDDVTLVVVRGVALAEAA
jgi:serine phosphatase RsbU (regulator of sigma subunit)